MRKIYFFLLFIFLVQNILKSQVVRFTTANSGWEKIHQNVNVQFDGKKAVALTNQLFTEKNFKTPHSLSFFITNDNPHTDSVFLYMGQWINFEASIVNGKDTLVLSIEKKQVRTLIDKLPMGKIVLLPNDTIQVIIKPQTTFFNFDLLNPTIVKKDAIASFVYATYYETHKPYVIVTLLFIGLMVAIFIYALLSLILQRTREYFYYGLYILFFLVYFGIRIYFLAKTDYDVVKHSFFAVHFIQIIGYVFYGYFIIEFFGLRKKNDILYKILILFSWAAILFVIADFAFIYLYVKIKLSMLVYVTFRYILIGVSAYTFYNLIRSRYFLSNYIAWGVFMLCFFGLISLKFSKTSTSFGKLSYNSFYDMRITLYQIGISLELIIFTMALQYKFVKRSNDSIKEVETLKLQNEKLDFENRMKMLEVRDKERTRIAQEIHDDIGSGLTNIRLMSEIAISKHQAKNPLDAELGKISNVANELVENMNEIVWAINTKNDNLKNTFAYLRRYVANYFEDYDNVDVSLDVEKIENDFMINGELRRSAFLLVKESLHNIVKHANATKVHFQLILLDDKFINIVIRDNGVGINTLDPQSVRNGIKNMIDRTTNFNGKIGFFNRQGTIVWLQLPITT